MDVREIATKADVAEATKQIMEYIKVSIKQVAVAPAENTTKKYLRSRDMKEMFGVCPNKLKDMRIKGEIPFIKRGATFFYPEDEVIKSMNKDLNNPKP